MTKSEPHSETDGGTSLLMQGRRERKNLSRVGTALAFLALVTVFAIFTVLVYATPSSPKEFAVLLVIVMVANSIWLAAVLAWERITLKRRRDRMSG